MINPNNLLQKGRQKNVLFHKYLLLKNKNILICFVEGINDSDYYLGKINILCGEKFKIIDCSSKANVLSIYEEIKNKGYPIKDLAFFIDRDFDIPLNNSDIFETDVYSIENYYCSKQAFLRILQYEFKISEDESYWDKLKSFYDTQFNNFHEVVGEFNAFYSILHKKNLCSKYKINLEDSFPLEWATTDVNNCEKKYNIDTLLAQFEIREEISNVEVINELSNLRNNNPIKVFRGKYELSFLFKILTFLVESANKQRPNSIINKKVATNLNKKRLMSALSQYADCPDHLKTYLENKKRVLP